MGNRINKDVPEYYKGGIGSPSCHCLMHKCEFVTYSEAPFEIAYAGEFGEVPNDDAWIGFGGDMEPMDANEDELSKYRFVWEEICKNKIEEAYKEYMTKNNLHIEETK